MSSPPPIRFSEPGDAEIAQYRAVSRLAVVGLVCGLLSPLAMMAVPFWAVPALAMGLSALALWRIARPALALTGRKAAMVGLVLGLVFAVAAPTDWLVYRRHMRKEARQFADLWFDYLRHGQPQKAHQLTLPPAERWRMDEALWEYYRASDENAAELRRYAARPPIRAILALGEKAQVRYDQTLDQGSARTLDWVRPIYAVTYMEDGQRKTFFVAVVLERTRVDDGRASWRIAGVEGGVRPPGM